MSNIIDNIRKEPIQNRNRVVWIITGIVAGILLIIWAIVGMPHRDGKTTDVINEFSNDIENNKDVLPQLFDNTKN